ncbi:uncharacterized protein LOC128636637 [Bombina bombina]|uniref:uncharacterized protein LOC128636637 n=1 Tax=Bombina bombina TaxID=8345 RepID=UPI00235A7057|nr:uncharacterized protein LOC128636637 [Bombina bombina]
MTTISIPTGVIDVNKRKRIMETALKGNNPLSDLIKEDDITNVFSNLEQLRFKETNLWWDIEFLELYISENRVPRGLRMKKYPSFALNNQKFMEEWNETTFGFKGNFLTMIHTIYQNPISNLLINSEPSPDIILGKGTRQGCPLSPLLFNLALEPFAVKLRQDLPGIMIGKSKTLLTLYADDLLLFMNESDLSIQHFLTLAKQFGSFAGYRINPEKSEILWFTQNDTPPGRYPFKLVDSINYLGIKIHKDPNAWYDLNFTPYFSKYKQELDRWMSLPISLSARVAMIKTLFFPQLLYLLQNLPLLIKSKDVTLFNNLTAGFLWNQKRRRISAQNLTLHTNMGGLALPNLKYYNLAILSKHILDWITEKEYSTNLHLEMEIVTPFILRALIHLDKRELPKRLVKIRTLLNPILAWHKLCDELKINWKSSKYLPIRGNPKFPAGISSRIFKVWFNKGLQDVIQIRDNRLDIAKSFLDLQSEFGIHKHSFYAYLQLRHMYEELWQDNKTDWKFGDINIIINIYRQGIRSISLLYNLLIQKAGQARLEVLVEKWKTYFPQLTSYLTNSRTAYRMKDKKQRILNHALDIIYLLTGEEYVIVKKNSLCDGIELRAGQVPVNCGDDAVYFAMDEWDYIEGHQEVYKEVMTEDQNIPNNIKNSTNRDSGDSKSEKRVERTEELQVICSWEPQGIALPVDISAGNIKTESVLTGENTEEPYTKNHLKAEETPEDTSVGKVKAEVVLSAEHSEEPDVSHHLEAQRTTEDTLMGEVKTEMILSMECTEEPYVRSDLTAQGTTEDTLMGNVKTERVENPEELHVVTHLKAKEIIFHDGTSRGSLKREDLKNKSCIEDHASDEFLKENPSQGEHSGETLSEKGTVIFPTSYKYEATTDLNMASSLDNNDVTWENMQVLDKIRDNNVEINTNPFYPGHEKSQEEAKCYTCNDCREGFASQTHLIVHQQIHTEQKTYPCNEFGEPFESSLFLHHRHTVERPHQCNVCGKYFSSKCNMNAHRRTHSGVKPYRCNECGRKFDYKSCLVAHQRIHTGERPHGCNICGKQFAVRSCLVRHMRVHTGEKPHVCVECGRCFSQTSSLIKHKKIHTGEKPYACLECGKRFTFKYNLAAHQKVHTG